jgi:hypothetical protein
MLYKSPFFWIVLSIVLIGVVIIIIYTNTKNQCPTLQSKKCGSKDCTSDCTSGQTYNCDSDPPTCETPTPPPPPPPPSACDNLHTCNKVTTSGKPGVGWCITEQEPDGKYTESCYTKEEECKGDFITDNIQCPYIKGDKTSTGCGPDSIQTKDKGGFKCDPVNMQEVANEMTDFGMCGHQPPGVRTWIENRTKYKMTIGGIGMCIRGSFCFTGGVITLDPYTRTKWDASNNKVSGPLCKIVVFFATLGTTVNDLFQITIDSMNTNSPTKKTCNTSNLLIKSPGNSKVTDKVKVTYKNYCKNNYTNKKVYPKFPQIANRIIFYPAWEMTAQDAVMT